MTIKRWTPVAGSILLLGVGVFESTRWQTAHSQEKPSSQQKPLTTTSEPIVETLKALALKFEKAFNAGRAQEIVTLFAPTAEVIDEEGDVIQGRPAIEARFAESFKSYPEAQIQIEVTSARQLNPFLAIEEGTSTLTLEPAEPPVRNRYTVIHVKSDGVWQFASVRDFPAEQLETAHDHLLQLGWLVGQWVDESPEGRVESTVRWSEDKNYLLQEYVARNRNGRELRGVQRIGYDPLRKTIRAWAFDHSGSFAESVWTPVEGAWVIAAEGVTAAGLSAHATRVLTPLTTDSYQLDSSGQVVGGERLPDSSIRVVRLPPRPAE
ncbi:SgcJ/EcaC family oxidoreductase [Schlesneria sp. DSM 10557]|uniref:YybH family protein n=1 Tax=Schlesneria sp. DSM 10557 TaxID=3044399 RepID=UPI00359F214E